MPATVSAPATLTPEQVANMSVEELRAEVKLRYERSADIEKKYPDGPISDKDEETESRRLLASIDVLEDRLLPFEEADQRKRRIFENVERYSAQIRRHQHATPNAAEPPSKSVSEQFLEAAQYKTLLESGIFRNNSNRFDLTVPIKGSLLQKALVWSGTGVGGALVQNQVLPTVPSLLRETTFLDLIPTTTTISDTIEYPQETFTNAAAPTPEASATTGTSGTKPEATFIYTPQTAPVRTIAQWVPVTNRMLADAPALRGYIDARLLAGLNVVLESQVISGDGTGENVLGLLNATGINIQARGTDPSQDAILKGMTQVRVTGLSEPSAVVLNAIDFQNIRLARENAASATFGGYLMGPPNLTGPTTLWGKPVVVSLGLAAGTALTGDFATACMLFDREEGQIRVGWIDQQFVRNMQTLLAELRAAFAVFRGAAFSKITGI